MTERTSKDRIVTIALQVTLTVLAFALMRWSILRWEELDRQGREESGTLDLLFGWPGWSVLLAMCIGAALFTLAVRSPVRPGFRWGRALWAILPFVLLWHLRLYFDWAEWGFHRSYPFLTELLGFDRVTFLDYQSTRWVLASLAGVALGSAIGRTSMRPAATTAAQPPSPDHIDSPSEPVSR